MTAEVRFPPASATHLEVTSVRGCIPEVPVLRHGFTVPRISQRGDLCPIIEVGGSAEFQMAIG